MLFTSPSFLFLFLSLAIFAFAITPNHYKKYTLLAFNLIFLMFLNIQEPITLILWCISLLYTYVAGREIRSSGKRSVLAFFVVADIIFFLIYRIFLVSAHSPSENFFFPSASFLLLSSISYMFDVHRKDTAPTLSFFDMAAYLTYFPTMLAGPVIKYKSFVLMLEQRSFTIEKISYGVLKFCVGFIKKVIIAASLTEMLSALSRYHFENVTVYSLIFGIFILFFKFIFEIWGYCDMAEGISSMLGYRLPPNFNNPMASTSITDFFSRFYIGLKEWLVDYVYMPLCKKGISPLLASSVCFVFGSLWLKTDIRMLAVGIVLALLSLLKTSVIKNRMSENLFLRTVMCFLTLMFMALLFFVIGSDGLNTILSYVITLNTGEIGLYLHFLYISIFNLKFAFVALLSIAFLLLPVFEKKLFGTMKEKNLIICKMMHSMLILIVFIFALVYFLPQFPEYFSVVFDFISL